MKEYGWRTGFKSVNVEDTDILENYPDYAKVVERRYFEKSQAELHKQLFDLVVGEREYVVQYRYFVADVAWEKRRYFTMKADIFTRYRISEYSVELDVPLRVPGSLQ